MQRVTPALAGRRYLTTVGNLSKVMATGLHNAENVYYDISTSSVPGAHRTPTVGLKVLGGTASPGSQIVKEGGGQQEVEMYRVTLTDRHYDLVRRFIVEHRLPNARFATQRMIELAAKGNGTALLTEEDDEDDQKRRDRRL